MMSINIRAQCKPHVQQFIDQYAELCDTLGNKRSADTYRLAAVEFLKILPEGTIRRPPYRLTENNMSKCLNQLVAQCSATNRAGIALALNRLLLICKQQGLVTGRVIIARHARREEIPIHDSIAFSFMDDFIPIREWLENRIQKTPRSKKDLPELIIASLIAINGVLLPSAHLKISACRRSMSNHLEGKSILSVPTSHFSSKHPPIIQYPLLSEINNLCGKLKGSDDWFFPNAYLPLRRDTKKRNTKRMNRWLCDLWMKVHEKQSSPPSKWNIHTFIKCCRIYFALKSPPVVTSYLSGRTFFGAYTKYYEDNRRHNVRTPSETSLSLAAPEKSKGATPDMLPFAQEVVEGVRIKLARYRSKIQNSGPKKQVANEILSIAIAYRDVLNHIPSLHYLIQWICLELNNDGRKRKMGSFQAMWCFIPKVIINELEHEDPTALSQDQWYLFAEYLIQEITPSNSTKKKYKQHLKAFHRYLCRQHPHMEQLNWRIGCLQVRAETSLSLFPMLSEFDEIFRAASLHPQKAVAVQLQAALTLAFFGGLRAEEICLISKMDVDQTSLQVRVWWSKTRKGRRRIPLGLLTPARYLAPVFQLHQQCLTSESLLFKGPDNSFLAPSTLGNRVKRLICETLPGNRSMSIHSFRHGFASWLLVRYMILSYPAMLEKDRRGMELFIPNTDHLLFSQKERTKLVRVFNGRIAGEEFNNAPNSFQSRPEHFRMISEMIGHATRDTTARTYIHSMLWIANYFIQTQNKQ